MIGNPWDLLRVYRGLDLDLDLEADLVGRLVVYIARVPAPALLHIGARRGHLEAQHLGQSALLLVDAAAVGSHAVEAA